MPSKVDDLVLRVEAMLFAAGKPLSVKELTETFETRPTSAPSSRALKKLARTYEQRQTALEVRRVGDRYALQLREDVRPVRPRGHADRHGPSDAQDPHAHRLPPADRPEPTRAR